MREKQKPWPYEDIVDLPHHVSRTHPPMDLARRAAQFAPFAALTGYEEAVEETARFTEEEIQADEGRKEEWNRQLLLAVKKGEPLTITFFVPDEKKAGGKYEQVTGRIRKLEPGCLRMEDGTEILLDHISGITV